MARNGHAENPLRVARHLRELTLQQLAERSEFSISGLVKVELGETKRPYRSSQKRIAAALGYEPSDIWPRGDALPHPDLRAGRGRTNRRGSR